MFTQQDDISNWKQLRERSPGGPALGSELLNRIRHIIDIQGTCLWTYLYSCWQHWYKIWYGDVRCGAKSWTKGVHSVCVLCYLEKYYMYACRYVLACVLFVKIKLSLSYHCLNYCRLLSNADFFQWKYFKLNNILLTLFPLHVFPDLSTLIQVFYLVVFKYIFDLRW